ncbi:MAG TPA: hypothetical protein VG013_03920 [Gemmataceae bacterium]|nr:hypothetical protein [Gemmataceae bacterium]
MGAAGARGENGSHEKTSIPQVPGEAEATDLQAWEMIESGRYMPRRIRGSCRGRELG